MDFIEKACLLVGRFLLGSYFVLPGIQKIVQYERMTDYMLAHSVPLTNLLLPLTIFIQLIAGLAIIVGFKTKFAALILAGLTLIISVYMHDFWVMVDGMERSHEMQNFVKNMAIMASLLIVVAIGAGKDSLDNILKNTPTKIKDEG
jgi:putative oxidoreductase